MAGASLPKVRKMPTNKFARLSESVQKNILAYLDQATTKSGKPFTDKTKTLYRSFITNYETAFQEAIDRSDLLDATDWVTTHKHKSHIGPICIALSGYLSWKEKRTVFFDPKVIAGSTQPSAPVDTEDEEDEKPQAVKAPVEDEKDEEEKEEKAVNPREKFHCWKHAVRGEVPSCGIGLYWPSPMRDDIIPFEPSEHIPKKAKKYIERDGEKRQAFNIMDSGDPVLLAGPAGTGKTELVNLYAHMRKIPMFKISCSRQMTSDDLLGTNTLKDKDTIAWNCGPVTQAIVAANCTGAAILLVDEINVLSPTAQKVFNSLCDDTRTVSINGKVFKVREDANLIVVGTMNPGYAGTVSINKELANRLSEITFDPPTSGLLLKVLGSTRASRRTIELFMKITQMQKDSELDNEVEVSTRTLKKVLKHMKAANLSFEESAKVQIANKFHNQAQRNSVLKVIQSV